MNALVKIPEPEAERIEELRPQAQIWAEPRHLFFFRPATLLGDGGHRPIEILAFAESGAIVRIGERLQEGARLTLELNYHYRFAIRVEWSSDTLAGLEFKDREQVRETLAARDRGHPYRAPRLGLDAEVVLRLGETCLTAQAQDVSEGGIKIELADPGHVGREASVIVPGMPPVAGRIRWCRDGHSGLSFERPLPFRYLLDCLTRQPGAPAGA
ncbi:MAG TPA: PilZ domain-containing protein [Allosphingosinicella sp.]|nr:PilZ domain-containing protein [Allosphingosinicella sp.]